MVATSQRKRDESPKPDPDGEISVQPGGGGGKKKLLWKPKASVNRTVPVSTSGMKLARKQKDYSDSGRDRYHSESKRQKEYSTRDDSKFDRSKSIPAPDKPDTVFDMFWSLVLDDEVYSEVYSDSFGDNEDLSSIQEEVSTRGRDPRRRPVPPKHQSMKQSTKEKHRARSSKHRSSKKKKTKKKKTSVDKDVMEYFLGDGNDDGSDTDEEPKRHTRRRHKGNFVDASKNFKPQAPMEGNKNTASTQKNENSFSDSDSLTEAPNSGCRMFGLNPGATNYDGCNRNPIKMATRCLEQTEVEISAAAEKINKLRREKHVSAADIEMEDIQEQPQDNFLGWWQSGSKGNRNSLEKWWKEGTTLPMCPMPPKFDPSVTQPQNESTTTTRIENFPIPKSPFNTHKNKTRSPRPQQENEGRDPSPFLYAGSTSDMPEQEDERTSHDMQLSTKTEDDFKKSDPPQYYSPKENGSDVSDDLKTQSEVDGEVIKAHQFLQSDKAYLSRSDGSKETASQSDEKSRRSRFNRDIASDEDDNKVSISEDLSSLPMASSSQPRRSASPKSSTYQSLQGTWSELESRWKKESTDQHMVTPIQSNITNFPSKEGERDWSDRLRNSNPYEVDVIDVHDMEMDYLEGEATRDSEAEQRDDWLRPRGGNSSVDARDTSDFTSRISGDDTRDRGEKRVPYSSKNRIASGVAKQKEPNLVGARETEKDPFDDEAPSRHMNIRRQSAYNSSKSFGRGEKQESADSDFREDEEARISRRRRIRENLSRIESLQARRRQLHASRNLNDQQLSHEAKEAPITRPPTDTKASLSEARSAANHGLQYERRSTTDNKVSEEDRKKRISELSKRRGGVRVSRHRFAHATKGDVSDDARNRNQERHSGIGRNAVNDSARSTSREMMDSEDEDMHQSLRIMPASLKLEIGARVARKRNEILERDMRRKRFNRSVHNRATAM